MQNDLLTLKYKYFTETQNELPLLMDCIWAMFALSYLNVDFYLNIYIDNSVKLKKAVQHSWTRICNSCQTIKICTFISKKMQQQTGRLLI